MADNFDLPARARRAVIEAGFHPDFPPDVLSEVQGLKGQIRSAPTASVRDLRNLLWSSIDNDTSRDLDQVEYAEKLPDGSARLLIGIADVDTFVPRGSAIDAHAGSETTSVYTGVATFPMLPAELSTDATSLVAEQQRLTVVNDLRIADSGESTCQDIYLALLRNRAKLAYS